MKFRKISPNGRYFEGFEQKNIKISKKSLTLLFVFGIVGAFFVDEQGGVEIEELATGLNGFAGLLEGYLYKNEPWGQ